MLAGGAFRRVLLVRIAQRGDLRLAPERVVVDADLGIQRHERALGRLDQGVDLDHARIGALHRVIDGATELAGRLGAFAGEPEAEGEAAPVVGRKNRSRDRPSP